MRAERLLRILLLLQGYESLTAGELARRLEVSARTIQRDLDSLSLAGVPVYASRGRSGGWTLARDYRTRLNGLTPAEAMTVFVGTTAHVLADLGLYAAADGAFAKLLSALPANARKDAEYARARVPHWPLIIVSNPGGPHSDGWLPGRRVAQHDEGPRAICGRAQVPGH